MEQVPTYFVQDEAEAVRVIELLRLQGYTEVYAGNPDTGERVKLEMELVSILVFEDTNGR